jgi:LPXTG-motif cell wall-anchored protein
MNYNETVFIVLASTYGSGVYGAGPYGVGWIIPGILPNTGASWLALAGAALVAVGGGLFVWLRRKRHNR